MPSIGEIMKPTEKFEEMSAQLYCKNVSVWKSEKSIFENMFKKVEFHLHSTLVYFW